MHACIYIHARLATRTSGSPMRAHRTHARPRAASVRARVCACDWAPTHPRQHVRAPSVGMDRGWLGAQTFQMASAFNANIGAWNTAALTVMSYVCAAFPARAARYRRRDALGGSSIRRRPVCAAAPPMRAHVFAQSCGHAHAWVPTFAGTAARTKDGCFVCMDVRPYISMHALYIHLYIYTKVHVYLCERRVCACMWLRRLPCLRACDCARRRCSRFHHVRAWVRPPVYIASAHVMYEYIHISMQSRGI
jgi:hypothetical protein